MRVIDSIASAFINTFGITVPSESARRRASWFIVLLLVLTVIIVALVGAAFYRALHAGVGGH